MYVDCKISRGRSDYMFHRLENAWPLSVRMKYSVRSLPLLFPLEAGEGLLRTLLSSVGVKCCVLSTIGTCLLRRLCNWL